MQNDVVAIENSMADPQQQQQIFENRTFPWSAILLLGIYPKLLQSVSQRDISTPMFIATSFIKDWEQPICLQVNGSRKCSIYAWWNTVQYSKRRKEIL